MNGPNYGGKVHRKNQATTVLFVDGDPSCLAVRLILFEALGYSVLTAGSGEEALQLLHSLPVHAMVLDYELPSQTDKSAGEEIIGRIRKAHPKLPVILSASARASIPASVLETVDGYLAKGTGLLALAAALEQVIHPAPIDLMRKGTRKRAAAYGGGASPVEGRRLKVM
jgi:CheY-like chemotaxis protein